MTVRITQINKPILLTKHNIYMAIDNGFSNDVAMIRKFTNANPDKRITQREIMPENNAMIQENIRRNNEALKTGEVKPLKEQDWSGKIGVIIGSGASISSLQELFKKIRHSDKFVTFAVNAAADYAFPHYDYAVTIDWLGKSNWMQKHSEASKAIGVLDCNTLGKIPHKYMISFSNEGTAFKLIQVDRLVTGTAVFTNLMWKFGVRKFVYFGQEFCVTNEENRVNEPALKSYHDMTKMQIKEDMFGRAVITNTPWYFGAETMKAIVRLNEDCEFFNATDCGLFYLDAPNFKLIKPDDVFAIGI